MPDFDEILNRLKDIISTEIGNKKVFNKDLADALGINQTTLATMKKRNKIPYKQVLDFCAKRKISINWLFYDQIVNSLHEQTDKFVRVKYLKDIYASAGGGAQNYESESEYLTLDSKTMEHLNISHIKNVEAINIIGDSMEPTLLDGSVVFVDTNEQNINRGGIFVVSTPYGIFVKRLQIKTDGTMDLISDNSSYGVENVRCEDVKILGKVVGILSEVG